MEKSQVNIAGRFENRSKQNPRISYEQNAPAETPIKLSIYIHYGAFDKTFINFEDATVSDVVLNISLSGTCESGLVTKGAKMFVYIYETDNDSSESENGHSSTQLYEYVKKKNILFRISTRLFMVGSTL